MNQVVSIFRANIRRVRAIHALHASFTSRVTAVVDLSDLLRAEIVLIVSALDHFIHELTRSGMMQVWAGRRAATPAYLKFPISLNAATQLAGDAGVSAHLETEIRARHSIASFQHPDSIADAIRLVSTVALWNKVAAEMSQDPKTLKARLRLLVDRRNKIAHEADIDPSFPGQQWPILPADVEEAITLVEDIGEAIFRLVT